MEYEKDTVVGRSATVRIHPTAVIDSSAEVHREAVIGPYCQVGPHSKIGRGTVLRNHVMVESFTEIGEENVFYPFGVIGGNPQDLKYKGEPTTLRIGNRNVFRESVSINRGTVQDKGETRIGNENLFMAYVHIGHDSTVGNHVVLANYVGLAGHVQIDDFAILSGMVGVSQQARIGAHTYLGGQSGIERSIPPFTMAFGSRPCKIRGANIVGLKRRGFQNADVQTISEAIKLYTREEVPKEQGLIEIETQYGENPHIQDFVRFCRETRSLHR